MVSTKHETVELSRVNEAKSRVLGLSIEDVFIFYGFFDTPLKIKIIDLISGLQVVLFQNHSFTSPFNPKIPS